jgi:hypothetical protein
MFLIAIPEGCKRLAGWLRSSATDTPGNPTQSTPTPAGVAASSMQQFLVNSQSPSFPFAPSREDHSQYFLDTQRLICSKYRHASLARHWRSARPHQGGKGPEWPESEIGGLHPNKVNKYANRTVNGVSAHYRNG